MPQEESRGSVGATTVRPPIEPREAVDTLKFVFHGWEISAPGCEDEQLVWTMLLDEAQKAGFSDFELFRRAALKAFIPAANAIRKIVEKHNLLPESFVVVVAKVVSDLSEERLSQFAGHDSADAVDCCFVCVLPSIFTPM